MFQIDEFIIPKSIDQANTSTFYEDREVPSFDKCERTFPLYTAAFFLIHSKALLLAMLATIYPS